MALASAMNMSGTDASKPASGFIAGRIYIATDTHKLYVDSGSAWVDSGLGSGGGGSASLSVSTKTTTYTITSSDDVILADATSGAFTVTLPTAVSWTKRITILKLDSSANAVTVGTTGGQTIDGQSTRLLNQQWSAITLVSDNSNWKVSEMAQSLTTLGDLLVGAGSNNSNRLAVGSNGQVLAADSTQTLGVKWATPTVVKIAEQILGANTATVSFTSIPGTYRHLWLTIVARATGSSDLGDVLIEINSDTGSNYDLQQLQQYQTTLSGTASRAVANTSAYIGVIAAATSPAGAAGFIDLYLYDYADTNWRKMFKSVNLGGGNDSSSSHFQQQNFAGVWRSTAAITRIDLTTDQTSFATNSVFTLYGIS